MATFFRNRTLKREVQKQLDSLDDKEKVNSSPGSGHSTPYSQDVDECRKVQGIKKQVMEDGTTTYVVGWAELGDSQHPRNWSMSRRLRSFVLLILIDFAVTSGSGIDSAVQKEAARNWGVSEVLEVFSGTAIFQIGLGIGAFITSPLSELFGRLAIYISTMCLFACWQIGAALSPNVEAQIAFRFLAGFCGSAPLTVAGGTLSDLWNPKQKTWAFPVFSVIGFGEPILGPVMTAFIPVTGVLSWHGVDWVSLLPTGIVLVLVVFFMEETLADRLLYRKAMYFRQLTGDDRFVTDSHLGTESLAQLLKRVFGRPFVLASEPIVISFTLYLTLVYVILFTFLDGFSFIFEQTCGINSGLSYTIFVALFIGVLLQLLMVPYVMQKNKKQLVRDADDGTGKKLRRESRLLFAMYTAPLLPIGLFWMAWTDYSSISIWSPILACVAMGASFIDTFISAYMYIVDSYETYAASALTFAALARYLIVGGMTVAGLPMYENLGTHYTLTILASVSVVAVPLPYILHKWGPRLRKRSKYAIASS